ncbi:hypothetical protein D3C73_1025130 [compost metagenome]
MEHLKAEQRAMMAVLIHLPTRLIRQARYRQQRLRQALQGFRRQILWLMLGRQLCLPKDLGPQVVAQPGEKRLIEQHAAQLPAAKCR